MKKTKKKINLRPQSRKRSKLGYVAQVGTGLYVGTRVGALVVAGAATGSVAGVAIPLALGVVAWDLLD